MEEINGCCLYGFWKVLNWLQNWLDLIYNPRKKTWNKVEKSDKIWYLLLHVFFFSVFLFSFFFWLLFRKTNFWKRDWPLSYSSTQIQDFSKISWFPKILSLYYKEKYISQFLEYHEKLKKTK